METYRGHVKTPTDAIILFEACRLGHLPRVQRRLSEKERQQIRSGSVFVWDEREAGMRRWTDGKSWSASRVSGSFLTYREMEGKRGSNNFSSPSQNQNGKMVDDLDDPAGPDGYRYKPDGLMKQSFSITTTLGQHLHLISYIARGHPPSNGLPQPTSDPNLRMIRPEKGMYPESTMHDVNSVSAVTRSPLGASPYGTSPGSGRSGHPQNYLRHNPRMAQLSGQYGWPPSPMDTPPTHYTHHSPYISSPAVDQAGVPAYASRPSGATQFDRAPPPLNARSFPGQLPPINAPHTYPPPPTSSYAQPGASPYPPQGSTSYPGASPYPPQGSSYPGAPRYAHEAPGSSPHGAYPAAPAAYGMPYNASPQPSAAAQAYHEAHMPSVQAHLPPPSSIPQSQLQLPPMQSAAYAQPSPYAHASYQSQPAPPPQQSSYHIPAPAPAPAPAPTAAAAAAPLQLPQLNGHPTTSSQTSPPSAAGSAPTKTIPSISALINNSPSPRAAPLQQQHQQHQQPTPTSAASATNGTGKLPSPSSIAAIVNGEVPRAPEQAPLPSMSAPILAEPGFVRQDQSMIRALDRRLHC